jgi:hypothetical protein
MGGPVCVLVGPPAVCAAWKTARTCFPIALKQLVRVPAQPFATCHIAIGARKVDAYQCLGRCA